MRNVVPAEPIIAPIVGAISLSMSAIARLEDIYGDTGAATAALTSFDAKTALVAVAAFLSAMSAMSEPNGRRGVNDIVGEMTAKDFKAGYAAIFAAIKRDKDDEPGKGTDSAKAIDWDSLYFTSRYDLLMTDAEFWACTRKKLNALFRLLLERKGVKSAEAVTPESNEAALRKLGLL